MNTSSIHRWAATLGVIGGLFLLANCSRQDGPIDPGTATTAQAPTPTASPQVTGAAVGTGGTPATPTVQANSRSVTVESLTLRFESGGHINLSGKDRWGRDYNTTYENQKFLLDALPVLERAFSKEQMEVVRKQLEQPPAETTK